MITIEYSSEIEIKALTRKRGATFCQVAKTRQENQGSPAITLGNQKWKGNRPILTVNPLKIVRAPSRERGREGSQVKEIEDLNRLPNINNPDPRA